MNDDSQALLAAFDGVIDGTCTLVKAIETVSVLAATLDSGSSSSSGPPIAPSSSSPEKEDASNLLDLLDSSPSEDTSVVWNKPAVPALKSPQYSSSSFTLRPPPSEAPPAAKAIFDPFGTDPFGPGTSSIDDLLSSSSSSTAAPQKVFAPQTSDMFAGMSGLSISGQGQGQGQGQAQDRTTPLSTAPTSETVQSMDTASASVASKPIVDLNALIFTHTRACDRGKGFAPANEVPCEIAWHRALVGHRYEGSASKLLRGYGTHDPGRDHDAVLH